MSEPILLTQKETTRLLAAPRWLLQIWEEAGHGPTPIHSGSSVHYLREEVEAFRAVQQRYTLASADE